LCINSDMLVYYIQDEQQIHVNKPVNAHNLISFSSSNLAS